MKGYYVQFAERGAVSAVVQVAVVVAVLAAGLGGGYLLSQRQADGPESSAGERGEPVAVSTPEGEAVDSATEDAVSETIDAFLAAEADQDYPASFAQLTPEDQGELGPVGVWVRDHANLPPITGHEIVAVRTLAGRTEVVTDVALRSSLDQVVGLVPARGRATWVLEEVDGAETGWGVVYSESVLEPRYPDDGDAAEAALTWAQSRQACNPDVGEHDSLIGSPSIALALCGSEGRLEVGEVEDLREGDQASAFVAAYGPAVFDWARVVALSGPVPLRVVLAPIGDRWVVMGVQRA